ncbi:general transcription factor 3C polypeptide 6 [Latimeria chalumnae]|uniref:general transcription factor 3C polypeptide 6 n=1 Tax=Latimeria chalumnae TaxID=7897 RepID=UPI0003C1A5B2|nr:PREDICTED: general transcription factor 3C polypeptide 6 [Latimeria chalumnae]|eukprot:XP_006004345.1 PREDICTED: general transcription factor 3C polypeptide 6 [Latimeria chalumnae]
MSAPVAGGSGGCSAEKEMEVEAGDWEEEEQLVLVELSGIIDSDFLTKCENKCKILGIATERPIMQVGRYVFAGEYEDALGTCVLFEEDTEHDPDTSNTPLLKYNCHTVKKLKMNRTFLSEKKEGEESAGGIEYLQIKENEFTRRSGLICSYVSPKIRCTEEKDEPDELQDELLGDRSHRSSESEGGTSDAENTELACKSDVTSSLPPPPPLPDPHPPPEPDSPAASLLPQEGMGAEGCSHHEMEIEETVPKECGMVEQSNR